MNCARCTVGAVIFSLSVMFSAPAKAKLSLGDKALLQSVMQQYIDKSLVGGAFLHLDAASGGVRPLHPDAAHPMILRMGKYFVLCAVFRDVDEKAVNVDFYLAPQGRSYVVFQSLVEDRTVLARLMKNGGAKRVD